MQGLIGIGRRIVKPANCALAFGIPTSRKGFADRLTTHSDFALTFRGGWPEYHAMVVGIFESIAPILRAWGVTIVEDLRLPTLRGLFRNGHDVVIMFSHWKGNAVETFDGFVDPPTFLEQVPEEFSGLIDLCVCHPCELYLALRRQRRKCLVKEITKEATPGFWLYFYWALFRTLKDEEVTYLEALEKVIGAFIKRDDEGSTSD